MRQIPAPSQDANEFIEFRFPGSRPGTFGRLILIFSLPGQVVACRGESRPGHGLVPDVRLAEWAVVILGPARLSALTASTAMSASTGTSAGGGKFAGSRAQSASAVVLREVWGGSSAGQSSGFLATRHPFPPSKR